ncbi:MAG: hypothetical protein U0670_07630 [Anaerolineae bacterium]
MKRITVFLLMSALFIGAVFSAAAEPAADVTPITLSCGYSGGGDQITRGFYVTGFPGDYLDTVTLRYYAFGAPAGVTGMTLVARLNSYGGAVLGTASVSADFTVTQTLTYNFGGVPVPMGSTITFTQIPDGYVTPPDGYLFYDTGTGPCAGITETNGTLPVLDSYRRDSIGTIITGHIGAAAGTCLAIPAGSVVGALPNATQAYYAPGQAANGVIINAGTYWVIGQDESHQFYKILLGCQFLWVPVNSMEPSHQAPWTGQALPTTVVG